MMLAYPAFLSRVETFLEAYVLIFFAALGPEVVGSDGSSPETLEDALQAISRDFPTPFQEALGGEEIARRLLDFAGTRPESSAGARARLLAAAALESAGEEEKARNLRRLVLAASPDPQERAEAAFAVGMGYLVRERYPLAERYLGLLPWIEPGSTWDLQAERYLPYFDVLQAGIVQPFEGDFIAPDGRAIRRRREDLPGQYTVISFWAASLPGGKAEVQDLLRIEGKFKRSSGGRIEVLGVNLDPSGEGFERALLEWGNPWPQHRDGLGFESPLVRAFGIPLLPHWVLAGPDGCSWYIGSRLTGRRSLEEALFSSLPPPKIPPNPSR